MSRKQEPSLAEQMHAKSWRALPQHVARSSGTKPVTDRFIRDILRACAFVLLFGGGAALLGYVAYDMVSQSETEAQGVRPVAVEFVNKDNGFLDEAWFRKWTRFDENSAPNLNALCNRIREYPQVSSARILRLSDGKIRIEVRERCPVARLVDVDGNVRLVSENDGVIFPSENYPLGQSALPVLRDVKILHDAETGFERIAGAETLTEFIVLARSKAYFNAIYSEWGEISLKHLPEDPHEVMLPWAVFTVYPRATSQNPAHAQITEYVFSAGRFREDLKLLAAVKADSRLENALSAQGHPKAYRVLFITNRKTPGKEFREMRLIPVDGESL